MKIINYSKPLGYHQNYLYFYKKMIDCSNHIHQINNNNLPLINNKLNFILFKNKFYQCNGETIYVVKYKIILEIYMSKINKNYFLGLNSIL